MKWIEWFGWIDLMKWIEWFGWIDLMKWIKWFVWIGKVWMDRLIRIAQLIYFNR